ncbi:MAG: SpoIVB peptidase [Ruminococcus sp.]|nr:SpoIVB peptidase [Ruminococcus sp.]
MKMRIAIRRAAALLGAASLSVLGLIGFYERSLPDFFYLDCGRELSVNSVFPVTAQCGDPEKEPGNMTDQTLMLFDTFPIKTVQTSELERPELLACGQAFGIKLMTDGVMVIGLEDIGSSCPASECGIRIGDVITGINGQTVTTNKRVGEIIGSTEGRPCSVSLNRSGRESTVTLTPVYSEGTYKAGMWVRDSSAGIGTLTFCDPETGGFGGLGHPICDADTKQPMPISHGTVGEVIITGCAKSEHGEPGQLIGEFRSGDPTGTISKNVSEGVFGQLDTLPVGGELLPLAFKQEIREGSAYILSTVDGGAAKRYSVVIESIDLSDSARHDMIVRVTDRELLDKAGGIVQGMSGSPIIQDGRLVGAVTHVFVDDPTQGYAIFAESMYKALKDN